MTGPRRAGPPPNDPSYVLTGPTAGGKKRVALLVAKAMRLEILSLDSMKVYRGMDVGTDKWHGPSDVPVHLVDLVGPDQPFSTGRYLEAAARTVEAIRARGRGPLFVGGTGLYLKGLLNGLFEGPAADPALRAELHEEANAHGGPRLHARLAEVDPDAAARIDRNDVRRIVRALEVFRLTGQPISELWRSHTRRPIEGEFRIAGLRYDRAYLRERIESRVDAMFAGGLLEECRRIRSGAGFCAETACAIGYREAIACLERKLPLPQAIAQAKVSTWQFARRQETWFRQFSEIAWIDVARTSTPEEVAERVVAVFRERR